ncbi:MAG: hypothetical protein J6B13_02205 [Muribaculaceae bacterium]|nr:hypothetical protein [Muribaculaceae bacterium]
MAKKKAKESKLGGDVTSLTAEELQNLKFRVSIEVSKEVFDKLVKTMLNPNKMKGCDES